MMVSNYKECADLLWLIENFVINNMDLSNGKQVELFNHVRSARSMSDEFSEHEESI